MRTHTVALACVMALVLAACSSSDSADTTTTEAAPSTSTTTEPPTTTTSSTTTTTTEPEPTTTTLVALACSEAAESGSDAGEQRVDACDVSQAWVPAGVFTQGTESTKGLNPPSWAEQELRSEQPAHQVEITTGYWIDVHEVTNADYQAFVDAGGYGDPSHWSEDGWGWAQRQGDAVPVDCGGAPDEPRVCVTWYEAEAYAHWRGGRLPTESEWEYAARGPDSSIYPWGNTWDAGKANVVDAEGVVAVGSYPDGASWVGALDMAGNAMEWVSDWMSYSYYTEDPAVDPQGPDGGVQKIEKGGWWGADPYVARSAYRHFEDPPSYQDDHIGLRVVTPPG
ncbi:MAG: formylglycine-generating enzyme family protein [Acidimicrobiia bacterium]